MLSSLEQIKLQNKVSKERFKYGKMMAEMDSTNIPLKSRNNRWNCFHFTRCGYHGEFSLD